MNVYIYIYIYIHIYIHTYAVGSTALLLLLNGGQRDQAFERDIDLRASLTHFKETATGPAGAGVRLILRP